MRRGYLWHLTTELDSCHNYKFITGYEELAHNVAFLSDFAFVFVWTEILLTLPSHHRWGLGARARDHSVAKS